jgi:hypothetical protein
VILAANKPLEDLLLELSTKKNHHFDESFAGNMGRASVPCTRKYVRHSTESWLNLRCAVDPVVSMIHDDNASLMVRPEAVHPPHYSVTVLNTAVVQQKVVNNGATGTLTGIIWDDVNSNGIQDKKEIALSDISIMSTDVSTNKNFIASTTTSTTGSWVLNEIKPGNYYVSINLPNNKVFSTGNCQEVFVTVTPGVVTNISMESKNSSSEKQQSNTSVQETPRNSAAIPTLSSATPPDSTMTQETPTGSSSGALSTPSNGSSSMPQGNTGSEKSPTSTTNGSSPTPLTSSTSTTPLGSTTTQETPSSSSSGSLPTPQSSTSTVNTPTGSTNGSSQTPSSTNTSSTPQGSTTNNEFSQTVPKPSWKSSSSPRSIKNPRSSSARNITPSNLPIKPRLPPFTSTSFNNALLPFTPRHHLRFHNYCSSHHLLHGFSVSLS